MGEYGGKFDRPHYHILLYNTPVDYFEDDLIHNKTHSTVLESCWKKGIVDIEEFTRGTAHYTTTFHLFPTLGEWKENDSREKPFAVMSRRPGIGINYVDDEITNYFNRTKNSYATLKNGVKQTLGRYYKEKITEYSDNPDLQRWMQEKAARFIEQEEERIVQSYLERNGGDIEQAERHRITVQREEYKLRTREVKNRLINHGKL